jgi:hypothetical protein
MTYVPAVSPAVTGWLKTTGQRPALDLRDTRSAAHYLHRLGLNVLSQPYGTKGGYRWRAFLATRLAEDDLDEAFGGSPVNIAVMTGRTSGNLLVIDCETAAAFGNMMARIDGDGLPLFAVKSARGGHVYLRCTDGEIASIKSGIIPDIEVRGSGGYVLAAPSLHPSGAIYELLRSDGIPQAPLKALRSATGLDLHLARTNTRRSISPATAAFLVGQTPHGQRNTQLYTSARELLGRGQAETAVRARLTAAADLCGLPAKEVNATIGSAIKAHHRHPAKTAPLWQRARTWALSHTWQAQPGTRAASLRSVYLAHTARAQAEAAFTGHYRASERELSELSGLSRNVVHKCGKALIAMGLIELVQRDQIRGNQWQLRNAEYEPVLVNTTARSSGSFSALSFHDAMHRHALGSNAALALDCLMAGKSYDTLREMIGGIADCGALSESQARRVIDKLRSAGLVRLCGDGWRLDTDDLAADLDRVAYEAGTAGKAEAKREKHRQERQARALLMVISDRRLARNLQGIPPVPVPAQERPTEAPAWGEQVYRDMDLIDTDPEVFNALSPERHQAVWDRVVRDRRPGVGGSDRCDT